MEVYIDLSEASAALSILYPMWNARDERFAWTYPMGCRIVLKDNRPGIINSPFADRDTLTLSIWYYGAKVQQAYRAFCRRVLQELRAQLKGAVRLHPGKFDPENSLPGNAGVKMSPAMAAANSKWDPNELFGSEYFAAAT